MTNPLQQTSSQSLEFDAALIRRYGASGPRYTSYPTAIEFTDDFDLDRYQRRVKLSAKIAPTKPLSLYFHIPFCSTVCYYCACNKIVTKNKAHTIPYLRHVYKEIALQSALFGSQRVVDQLHWGGGTPTFLSHVQASELMAETARHFSLRSDDRGDYSIEIDPRGISPNVIVKLRELGFNRISLGVQDFDPAVQKAVNRIQSVEETHAVVVNARNVGFRSVNIDLIYGLPLQTRQTFARTLDRIVEIDPDRLSIFNYAHLPSRFKVQRQIDAAALPDLGEKLRILQLCVERLIEAGYVYIGMDHFAKPDDALAVAQRERHLHRNFQGYSTHRDCDLVGIGVTAIGNTADTYVQNTVNIDAYYRRVDQGRLAIVKGVELSADDRIRRHVIGELICHFSIDLEQIGRRFGIDPRGYFRTEYTALEALAHDNLLDLDGDRIVVTPKGRLLIRNICMAFDRYRQVSRSTDTFSKLI